MDFCKIIIIQYTSFGFSRYYYPYFDEATFNKALEKIKNKTPHVSGIEFQQGDYVGLLDPKEFVKIHPSSDRIKSLPIMDIWRVCEYVKNQELKENNK